MSNDKSFVNSSFKIFNYLKFSSLPIDNTKIIYDKIYAIQHAEEVTSTHNYSQGYYMPMNSSLKNTSNEKIGIRENFKTIKLNDYYYILSGQKNNIITNNIIKSHKNTYKQSTISFSEATKNYTTNTLNNHIYIIGGTDNYNTITKNIRILNYNNSISTITMSNYRLHHSSTVFNNKIFIIGGISNKNYKNKINKNELIDEKYSSSGNNIENIFDKNVSTNWESNNNYNISGIYTSTFETTTFINNIEDIYVGEIIHIKFK